ncbi:ankyrin repeat and SOCS box protein 18 [Ambystoma mexicanum]|uniref:ankyrin repeat and SOCS box protein 18 n=1 Tax=Ambystoma mexicanum TaxID=8296 RepID=UPI0037E7B9E4
MSPEVRRATVPGTDAQPDYSLYLPWVQRLKLALERGEGSVVSELILVHAGNVNGTIELANDDWLKDPRVQLPPSVLLGDLHFLKALPEKCQEVFDEIFEISTNELEWRASRPATFGLAGLWSLEYKRELTNPLCITASRGYTDCLRYLLHRKADPNAAPGGQSALHEACARGHTECAQLLLEHRANPNLLSHEGLTPLHLCTSKDTLRCAKLLIKYGAAVNQASEDAQETPLHVAAKQALPEHALLYLHHGASVDGLNAQHETPLNAACGQDTELQDQGIYLQVCRLLLAHGANANTTDEEKKSPLHKACKNASHSLVELLLENGADVNAIDYNGASPLSCTLQTAAFKQKRSPQNTVMALLNHGSLRVWPTAFGKVLQTCASAPRVIEILFNSYEHISISDHWVDTIPEEVFQTHLSFYKSLVQLSSCARSLQHLCRCSIRKHFGSQCHCLIPKLPMPTILQDYLLLQPDGSLV